MTVKTTEKTLEQLREEILKLEQEVQKRLKTDAPPPLKNPDFSGLVAMLAECVEEHANEADDDDSEHYVWETAMEAVYGPDIWKWWNSR